MPRPAKRSRSLRRVKRKIPSGKGRISYKRRKPSQAKCAECKKVLPGTLRARPAKSKIAKTKKRPTRAYGGYLCHKCTKDKMKAEKLFSLLAGGKAGKK